MPAAHAGDHECDCGAKDQQEYIFDSYAGTLCCQWLAAACGVWLGRVVVVVVACGGLRLWVRLWIWSASTPQKGKRTRNKWAAFLLLTASLPPPPPLPSSLLPARPLVLLQRRFHHDRCVLHCANRYPRTNQPASGSSWCDCCRLCHVRVQTMIMPLPHYPTGI